MFGTRGPLDPAACCKFDQYLAHQRRKPARFGRGLVLEGRSQSAREFQTDLIVVSLCHEQNMALLGNSSNAI
jgi:hypothetical protein